MSGTDRRLQSIIDSLARGYSFGPNRRCVVCDEQIDDADAIDRGICPTCWGAVEEARNA